MEQKEFIIDISEVRENKARRMVKSMVSQQNISFEEREDFWNHFGSDELYALRKSIIFTDLARLVNRVKNIGENHWSFLVHKNNAYFFSFIRNSRDEKVVSYIDDIVKLSNNRLSVFDVQNLNSEKFKAIQFKQELDRVLRSCFHPHALKYAHVHKKRRSVIVEFNDGLFGEVTYEDLQIHDEIEHLLLDTLRIGEFGNCVEIFTLDGEIFDIDAEVLRYFLSEEKRQEIAEQTFEKAHHIGKLLHQVRKNQKMTQKELATSTEIDQALISKIENGKHLPRIDTIERLAGGLNMSVTEFLSVKN